MKRVVDLTVDFQNKMYSTVFLKQMDTTEIRVQLLNNNAIVNLTSEIVDILFTKPDNTIVQQDATNIDRENGKASIELLPDCLRTSGKAKMEIEIKDSNNELLSSFYIPIQIEQTSKENVTSDNTPNYFEEFSRKINEFEKNSKQLLDWIESAEEQRNVNEENRETAEQLRIKAEQKREQEKSELEEETRKTIEELQTELRLTKQDLKAGTLEGEDTGESLYLVDSSDARFRNFEISGNSVQQAEPTLEKPSETQTVGQDVNIFDKDNVEFYNNNSDAFSSTANTNTIRVRTSSFGIEGGETYTLSGLIGKTILLAVRAYGEDENIISAGVTLTGNTFTLIKEVKYIYLLFKNSDDSELNREDVKAMPIKLQEGSKSTTYSPYGCGSTNIVIENTNKFIPTLYTNNIKINQARANITLQNDIFVFECTGTDMYLGNIAGTGERYSESCGKLINVKTLNSISIKLTNELFRKNFLTCFDKDLISLGIKQLMSNNLDNYILPKGTEYVTLRFGIGEPTVGTIYKTQVQLEGATATDYTSHKEQTFTMPIQQEMLENDCFEKIKGVWKEKHMWKKIELGTEGNLSDYQHSTIKTDTRGFFRIVAIGKDKKNASGSTNLTHCNCLKNKNGNANTAIEEDCIWWEGSTESIYLSLPFPTRTEVNNFLKEKYDAGTPIIIYYKLETPTYLGCTEEQIAILDEIEKTLHSYKNGTYVYCADKISPIFNVKYTKDTETYIENEIDKMQAMILAGEE